MLQFVQKYIINKRKGLINISKPGEMVCYSIGGNINALSLSRCRMCNRIGSHPWRDGINKDDEYP